MGTWMIHFLFPELRSQHLRRSRPSAPTLPTRRLQGGSDISCTPLPQSTGQGSGDVVGPEATHRSPSAVATGDL